MNFLSIRHPLLRQPAGFGVGFEDFPNRLQVP